MKKLRTMIEIMKNLRTNARDHEARLQWNARREVGILKERKSKMVFVPAL